jgi:23S rRNA (adenine2503-C2)-methyltransferase
MSSDKINLLGLPREQMQELFAQWGEKPFRARQVMKWIYARGISDFEQMTDLGKTLRERLAEQAEVRPPEIVSRHDSTDGTVKWALRAGPGQAIETVFIPEESRGTLCISSQVGCALDCSFCSTGAQGFNRNLDSAEIVGQVWLARRELGAGPSTADRVISNVVLMGMGEPLANYRAVVPAIKVMLDDYGFELSRRRVTLSTSGLVPQINKLAVECNVALAVSLHAANDTLRDELVPINRRHPIAELLEACWAYAKLYSNRHITFEYTMLKDVNDTLEHARQLARLLKNKPAKVNLIPFNPFPGTRYQRSPQPTIDRFRQVLLDSGIITVTRRTRGDDIDAACGQLAGKVNDRTRVRLGSKMISVSVQNI